MKKEDYGVKRIDNKKPHRLSIASSGSGFTVRINKENAQKQFRKAKKAARLSKSKKSKDGQKDN